MSKNSFKVLRPGINTTFQDLGRDNLYHVGLPFSGAIEIGRASCRERV